MSSAKAGWEGRVLGFLTDLAVGVVTTRLYSGEHPRAARARSRLIERLDELVADRGGPREGGSPEGELSLVVLQEELFIEGRLFTRAGEQVGALLRRLHVHGVERVTFHRGVTEDEVGLFLEVLAAARGFPFPTLEHIRVGRLVGDQSADSGDVEHSELPEVTLRDRVQVIRDAFSAVEAGRPLPVASLDDVIADLDRQLQHIEDPLTLLAPLDDDADWLAVHAHNVAVLTLVLAVPLGLEESDRWDLGLAGALHDIGKIGLAPEVLRKDLELSGNEWELQLDHPRIGLERLLGVPQIPPVAPIVAFEHHLTWQGGGWPRLPELRRPHPAASMVAVAEVFDILHTVRGPRGIATREGVAATLEGGSGTLFDPFTAQVMQVIWECSARGGSPEPGSGSPW